ncbi:PP2C family protein-serine/threonine phosphatase [Kitasatospora sp. NPDC057223]|uniref:PP2C family protein-serine/threonine phosphatase n=1 Tax=Kitasatospora sp. NPDC057223 TaxID=3346055 RepID=UPI0036292F46
MRGTVRPTSLREVLLCFAALTVVVIAGGSAAQYVLYAQEDRAAVAARHLADPADDAVGTLAVAGSRMASAQAYYLTTREARFLDSWHSARAEGDRQLTRLADRLTGLPALRDRMAGVESTYHEWTSQAERAQAERARGEDPGAAVAATLRSEALTGRLQAGTHELARALDQHREAVYAASDEAGRKAALAAWASWGALVLLLVLGTVACRSRIAPSLDRVTEQLGRLAAGDLDGRRTRRCPPGLGRLSLNVEDVRILLKEQRWWARRDREALEQQGEAVIGLRRLLVATGTCARGTAVHGDLIAAEGLLAGDFYDTLAMPDGSTALLLGDVAGHGVTPGLLAARIKCAMLSTLRLGGTAAEAVHCAWAALAHEEERFATLTVAVLDPAAGSLSWVNAGHEPPLLRRADGTVEELAVTGPLVSSLIEDPRTAWETHRTRIGVGDLLVLHTDGLSEARGRQGAQLGGDAVRTVLRDLPAPTPKGAVRALYVAAEQHGTDWARDDITILAAALDGRVDGPTAAPA